MDRMNQSVSRIEHGHRGGFCPRWLHPSVKSPNLRKIGLRIMKKTLLTVCGIALLSSGCALQQDVVSLERRLDTLEYGNQQLRKQNDKLSRQLQTDLTAIGENRESSERSLRGQYAGLNATMESMQQDLRLLNGRMEEVEFITKRKNAEFESSGQKRGENLDELKLEVAKIDRRLSEVEQYLSLKSQSSPTSPSASSAAAVQEPTAASDQQLYDEGRKAYDNGQMDKARQIFNQLIKDYPKSKNADNAQFWIGESYYRDKWYEKAILEYQNVIEKFPHGNKVPAAMLKQGMALEQIGEKASARLILEELVKKYPKSSEAGIASKKLKSL